MRRGLPLHSRRRAGVARVRIRISNVWWRGWRVGVVSVVAVVAACWSTLACWSMRVCGTIICISVISVIIIPTTSTMVGVPMGGVGVHMEAAAGVHENVPTRGTDLTCVCACDGREVPRDGTDVRGWASGRRGDEQRKRSEGASFAIKEGWECRGEGALHMCAPVCRGHRQACIYPRVRVTRVWRDVVVHILLLYRLIVAERRGAHPTHLFARPSSRHAGSERDDDPVMLERDPTAAGALRPG